MLKQISKYQNIFFSILILFSVRSTYLSFSPNDIIVDITDAHCSADGSIIVHVTDLGIPPYRYRLDTVTHKPPYRPLGNSDTITALESRDYILVIIDATGKEVSKKIHVGGNYTTPVLSAKIDCNTVTLSVAGGRKPFKYSRDGFRSDTSNSPVFRCLKNGFYEFTVQDSCGNVYPYQLNISNSDLYSYSYCTGTNVFTNSEQGCRPFTYVLKNEKGDSLFNHSGNFALFRGCSFSITMTDACGGRFVRNLNCNLALDLSVNCKSDSMLSIEIIATGGVNPYTYYLIADGRDTIYGNNGVFKSVRRCNIVAYVKDNCDNISARTVNCSVDQLKINFGCVNEVKGTATIVATGGTPPYVFKCFTNGITNSTGIFTKLPKDSKYDFQVTDACGRSKTAWIYNSFTTTYNSCPYDSILKLAYNYTYYIEGDCAYSYYGCNTTYRQLKYICLTCDTMINQNLDTISGVYSLKHVSPDSYKFQIINGCGDTIIKDVDVFKKGFRVSLYESDCRSDYQIGTTLSPSQTNTTYVLKLNGIEIARNTTGLFKAPDPDDKYWVVASNTSCNTDSDYIDLTPRVYENIYCEQINIRVCPDLGGYIYVLKSKNGTDLDSNSSGVFNNLSSVTEYEVIIKHKYLNHPISRKYITPGIHFNITDISSCSFLIIPSATKLPTNSNEQTTYTVFDSNNIQVTTGILSQINSNYISGLVPNSTYKVVASHKYCGMEIKYVKTRSLNIPLPELCVYPGFDYSSDKFKLKFTINAPYSVSKLSDNTKMVDNLIPGKYLIKADNPECTSESIYKKDTIIIPELPKDLMKLASQTVSCPQGATVVVSLIDSIWEKWTRLGKLNLCRYSNFEDRFYFFLYDSIGKIELDNNRSYGNSTHTFNGAYLVPGNWYTMYLSNYYRKDFIDTIKFQVPLYKRSTVTVNSDVLCAGVDTGCITMSIINGIAPYTFEVSSTKYDTLIKSPINRVTICHLKQGEYNIRVSDYCGISIDSKASMGILTMATSATDFECTDSFLLKTNLVLNTLYQWKNINTNMDIPNSDSSDLIVKNDSPKPIKYKVSLNTSNHCFLTDTVWVPVIVKDSTITVFAGKDSLIKSGLEFKLRAEVQPLNISGQWKSFGNNPSIATFSNPLDKSSNIIVGKAGKYGFIYIAHDNCNSNSDTIYLEFLNCAAPNLITIDSIICRDAQIRYLDKVLKDTGTYIFLVSHSNTCDDKISLKLRNRPFIYTNNSISSCFPAQVGIVNDTLIARLTGCKDSIVITTTNLIQPIIVNKLDSTCDRARVGIHRDTFQSVRTGCDSIINTTISLIRPIILSKTSSTCDVNKAGKFSDTVFSSSHCMTITVTNYIYRKPDSIYQALRACDSLFFYGKWLKASGIYVNTYKDQYGCDSLRTLLSLTIYQHYSSKIERVLCSGGEVSWHGKIYRTIGIFNEHFPSPTGCDSIFELTIKPVPVLEITLKPKDTTLIIGQSIKLNPLYNFLPFSIEWTPRDISLSCFSCSNPIISPLQKQTYVVAATDKNACKATASFSINIRQAPIYAPNVFTPNGDGLNDYFILSGNPAFAKINAFRIYNRWGDLVYEARDIPLSNLNQGWDGYYIGIQAPSNVYLYYAEIEYANGEHAIMKGDVTLVR